MTTRHEYIEKLKDKLDEWDSDIDTLEEKAQHAKADLKFEYEDQLTALRRKRDDAKLKLAELMDASEDAWDDLKQGADEAWDSLKAAIEKALSHFK
jgi:chromosome segregation ATPase